MKKKIIILVMFLVLLGGCGRQIEEECFGYIDDKGECVPTSKPYPFIETPQ